ncbi:MAG: hypothetical protein ACYC3I_17245 [Gemmataceae bacterium]
MRSAFVALPALAVALVVAGCSGNKGKIENTSWSTQAATAQGEEAAAGLRKLQFKNDGHLLYFANEKLFKGSYSLGMGSAVTFTLDEELEGRKIHPHKLVIHGEHLTLTSADGSTLTFYKSDRIVP